MLVGCGNMGYALLKSWITSSVVDASSIYVVEPMDELRKRAHALGVTAVANATDLPAELSPQIVVLAVKPQLLANVVADYKFFAPRSAFVSIAAGVPTSVLRLSLETDRVFRTMPNLPIAVGAGSTVV